MVTYDAVLFDNDGVLIEPPSPETQGKATRAAFQEMGIDDPDPRHVGAIVDGVTIGGLYEICTAYDLDAEAFWAARERHDERSQLDDFETGTRNRYDDVTVISDLSPACGIVSNNHHSTVEFVLDFFGFRAWFDTYYGREMTTESLRVKKPNPHYLDRARRDLDAESALYVGDSESDVLAAHRAGMDSVFVRRPHRSDAQFSITPTYDADDLHGVAEIIDRAADE